MTSRMSPLICLGVALALPAAFPQQQQTAGPAVEPLSTASHKCWTSGSGATYFQVCVSKHGNMVMWKTPAGVENIRLGNIGEGYAACASTTAGGTAQTYFDAGFEEAGWAEPYSVTAAPVISRKTQDGKLELVQSFTSDAAERDFTITMTLYNRSNGTLYNVRLDRYADFDVQNTPGSDIFNKSPRAVFAVDQAVPGNIIGMTELTAVPLSSAIHSWPTWNRTACNQPSDSSPTAGGDWVGRLSYNLGTIAKGASKTVKVEYRAQ